jgi:hypothetical protein
LVPSPRFPHLWKTLWKIAGCSVSAAKIGAFSALSPGRSVTNRDFSQRGATRAELEDGKIAATRVRRRRKSLISSVI